MVLNVLWWALFQKKRVAMTNQDTKFLTKDSSEESTKLIDSKELVGKLGYLNILHEGEVYRLRVTKFRKLILTK